MLRDILDKYLMLKEREKELKREIEVLGKKIRPLLDEKPYEDEEIKANLRPRVLVSYDVKLVRTFIPEVAPLVIEEVVNKKRFKELVDKGVISERQMGRVSSVDRVGFALYVRRKKT